MGELYQKNIHILRNPHGHTEEEVRAARLWAANEIERLNDAYQNMSLFAQQNGLNTAVGN